MRLLLPGCLLLIALTAPSLWRATLAQVPAVEEYRVRVVTKEGPRVRGVLHTVTENLLYIETRPIGQSRQVSLSSVRKVVIRRENKKTVLITGAIVGALAVGFVANEALQKSPVRSPVTHGLTLVFASAGGAAAGLILSSAIGNVSSRVIRPLDPVNPEVSLQRQLEPFSVDYQQNVLRKLSPGSY